MAGRSNKRKGRSGRTASQRLWGYFLALCEKFSFCSALAADQNITSPFEEKLKCLWFKLAPYEKKEGLRLKRGTKFLVSDSLKFLCIDTRLITNNITTLNSLTECSKALNLNRTKIKNSLLTCFPSFSSPCLASLAPPPPPHGEAAGAGPRFSCFAALPPCGDGCEARKKQVEGTACLASQSALLWLRSTRWRKRSWGATDI